MNKSKLEELLQKSITLKSVSDTKLSIESKFKFLNGQPIKLYLVEEGTKIYLSDDKCTIRYLNELYELKSADVKSCIANVLKLYSVKMIAGELVLEVQNENKFIEKLNNFILCINQLANMFVFFDKPE